MKGPPAKKRKIENGTKTEAAALPLAKRQEKLGTETAYAVSSEAQARVKAGKQTFALHIGDLNFPTPISVKNKLFEALNDNKTGYCPAAGIPELREALADYCGRARGVTWGPENVSVQSGGKPVILKFLLCVMEQGDEVLYPSPGYPIYESVINYLGGKLVPYSFIESAEGFELDLEDLKSKVTEKTKIFIYNNYHNPTGVASSDEEMEEIAKICNEHNLWVLSDEAYFDLVYDGSSKSIVALPGMKERTCILHTFSKSWSMTGWRLGAAIGPKHLIDGINQLNTNDEACTTHFVQIAGLAALKERKFIDECLLVELKKRRDVLNEEVNTIPGFHSHSPPSTFYLFVNVTKAMKLCKIMSVEEFRKFIMEKTGVTFCTREHFGKKISHPFDQQSYIRFAYSGISIAEIKKAMGALREFMNKFA